MWLGLEAEHSPPSSAAVKSAKRYIFSPPIRLNGVVPNKASGISLWHGALLSTETTEPEPCQGISMHFVL